MKKTIITDGVRPFRTKYDIQKFMKTRDMAEYLDNKVPMQSDKLKVRLLNEGYLEPKCAICERNFWIGETIPLQLDHINGNNDDNSLENLRLLCPNCHAQTPQYRLKDEFKGETYSNRDKDDSNRA
tara:strand:- start:13266 stop:13643 length:378 start_codon:yes stop_codon:yes gene_type:complete